VGLFFAAVGGILFAGFIALVLGLAAWEYTHLFRAGGFAPAGGLMILGAAVLALARAENRPQNSDLLLSLFTLAIMTYHLVAYERGRNQAATDFGLSLGGLLYLGWIGSHLVSLRNLPDGLWWLLLVLPSVWAADSAAYSIGRRWGRHKMSPRLSPNKSWEGYFAGVAGALLAGLLLGGVYAGLAGSGNAFTPLRGGLLGLALGALTPLGDLGESMIKRQVGMKDSSHLLPGHGGVFDRIDSWLWAGVIGFFWISRFYL
jgi:phosphatidate cytidylyltransferase